MLLSCTYLLETTASNILVCVCLSPWSNTCVLALTCGLDISVSVADSVYVWFVHFATSKGEWNWHSSLRPAPTSDKHSSPRLVVNILQHEAFAPTGGLECCLVASAVLREASDVRWCAVQESERKMWFKAAWKLAIRSFLNESSKLCWLPSFLTNDNTAETDLATKIYNTSLSSKICFSCIIISWKTSSQESSYLEFARSITQKLSKESYLKSENNKEAK